MSQEGQIDENEAREIVRLIGRVAMCESSRNDRRKELMDGLADLVNADAWLWFNSANSNAGEQPVVTFLLKSGLSDAQFAVLMSMGEEPDAAMLLEPFFKDLNASGSLTTRLQQQMFSMDHFKKTRLYQLWTEAGIGPAILSARPCESGQVSMVGFYRFFGREQFDERESRMAHITLSEIPSLHEDQGSSKLRSEILSLSPRLRDVLNCLIQGFTRKRIAEILDISVNTSGGYVADVYSRFGVHSQSELIRRFLVGDGGDLPADVSWQI
jgi:DNA-binding CsgD family transcriptional regulator